MTAMPTAPRHSTRRPPGLAAAWAILVGAGATSVVFNVFHAVQHGSMAPLLALLYGFAPVFVAALVSHIVAEHDGGWVMQAAAILVMLGAMALSIGATASVVKPAAGSWMQWLFGGVLDGATLVALRVILDARTRKARTATELEAAQEAVSEARSQAQEAAGKAVQAEAELASVKAVLGAELEAVKAELEAVRRAVPQGGPGKRPAGPRKPSRTAPEDDLALEAKALQLLAGNLDMTGAELARKLGVTEGYGRKLRRRLTDLDRPGDGEQDRPSAPVQDRPQDRSSAQGQDRTEDRS